MTATLRYFWAAGSLVLTLLGIAGLDGTLTIASPRISAAIAVTGFALLASLAAFRLVDRRSQERAWRRIAKERRELEVHRHDLGAMVDYCVLRGGPPSSADGATLIVRLAQVEAEAGEVLGLDANRTARRPFQIRSELQDRGVWSVNDLEAFDNATAVRNQLIHSNDDVSPRAIAECIRTADALLKKLTDSDAGRLAADGHTSGD